MTYLIYALVLVQKNIYISFLPFITLFLGGWSKKYVSVSSMKWWKSNYQLIQLTYVWCFNDWLPFDGTSIGSMLARLILHITYVEWNGIIMFNYCVVVFLFLVGLNFYYPVLPQNDIHIDQKYRHNIPRHQVEQVCSFSWTPPSWISLSLCSFTLL